MKDTEDFATLLNQFESKTETPVIGGAEPQEGVKVRGRLVSIGDELAFIAFGGKSEGAIEVKELLDSEGNLSVQVGDAIDVFVTSKDERDGTLLLSRHGRRMHGAAELEHAYIHHTPVEGLITGPTKGGVEVQIAGVRGFCPVSQLDIRYVEDPEAYVGQRLEFRITSYQGGRHINLVLSRRVLLEDEQKILAEQTRAQLQEGAVLAGVVTALKDYGAFVDLGGVEGMVHISEIAFGQIEHPQDLLSVGQQVEVSVLRIEKTGNPRHPEKIALSIRALAEDPWKDAQQRFPIGVRIEGKVSRLQPFGAFIELMPGIDGLAHISELGAGRRISHPREVLNVGDKVEVAVLSIDIEKRRIALSMNGDRHQPQAASEAVHRHDQGSQQKPSFGTLGDLLKETLNKKES